MDSTTKSSIQVQEERAELVDRLKKEAILQNIGRLLYIFMTLFSKKEVLKKLGKREGQEVQMNFPALSPPLENPCFTFILSENPSDPYMGPSKNPVLTITYNVEIEELFSTLNTMVSKKTLFGLIISMLKDLRNKKMKTKGSLRASLLFSKLFLIGDNEMYQQKD